MRTMRRFFGGILFFWVIIWASIPPAFSQEAGVYQVVRVAANDQLNVRRYPSTRSRIIGRLSANASGIISTGKQRKIGRALWLEINWQQEKGWVHSHYLKRTATRKAQPSAQPKKKPPTVTKPTASKTHLACRGSRPTWSIHINETRLAVNAHDGTKYQAPIHFRQRSQNDPAVAVIAGVHGRDTTSIFLQKSHACQATGGQVYPYDMTAILQSRQVVSGCCQIVKGR